MSKLFKQFFRCYGGMAPRYTSYPSAAHFENDFPSLAAVRFFQEQTDSTPSSIYIHIPFCRALCHYCGCFTRVVHDDNPIQEYLSLLKQEIILYGRLVSGRLPVAHIHFGGGSPNLLSGDDIQCLINTIDSCFGLDDGTQIALEADPRQMTQEKAQAFVKAGINRISLGVQDFNEQTQKAINRIQPYKNVRACTYWLRDAGIKSINFDLMYGLPYQTAKTVSDNAYRAVALEADRIALFGYAHVPWMRPHQRQLEKHILPEAEERYEQETAARVVFTKNGYTTIGMDHFSRPEDDLALAMKEGRLRRNFQGYTADEATVLLGFGLSAISRVPEAYMQNTSSFHLYKERLAQNMAPIERGKILSSEDKVRADIIERLMCYFEADIEGIAAKHDFPIELLAASLDAIASLVEDGLATRSGNSIKVADKGRPFIRMISACFDTYINSGTAQYSRAI